MKYANKKHPVAFLIAAILACQPISAQAITFADINQAPWAGAEVSINKAASLGLVVGETINGKNYFRPRDSVSLCETAQLAYKVLLNTGKITPDSAAIQNYSSFMNLYKIPTWAHTAVGTCLKEGIILPNELPTFMNNNTAKAATREQAATILGRALEVGVPSSRATAVATKFVDNNSISTNARPYIALLNAEGVVNGDDLNKFNPKSTLNRTETAVMVTNLYEVLVNAVKAPTSVKGKISTLTNYYLNLEGNSSFYFFPMNSSVTATLNNTNISLSELVKLFKSGVEMDAELTLTGNNEITKIAVTSKDVEEKDLKGKITSLSDSRIKIDSDTHEIKDSSKVTVKIDGSTKNFSTLLKQYKDGDTLEATVTLDDEGYVSKIEAKVTKAAKKGDASGKLTYLDSSNGDGYEASIELDEEDIYYIEDESELDVEIDGRDKTFSDLVSEYNAMDDDEYLEVVLTLDPTDSDYVTKIVIGEGSSSSDDESGIITDVDDYEIELDDDEDFELDDDVEIDITDGDNSDINDLDELIYAFEEGKVMDVDITIEDDYVVEIKGEVIEVTGTLIDMDEDDGEYTLTLEIDGEEYDYIFDGDEHDDDVVSVSGYGDSMYDFYDDFLYEGDELDDITLELKNDKIEEVKD